jgi:hypothetical protein
MVGILVDEITAVLIVVAVACAIFGGICGCVWWLANLSGRKVRGVGLGFGVMVAIWLAFAAAGMLHLVPVVSTMLYLAAGGVLICWLIIFYFLWNIDRASGS